MKVCKILVLVLIITTILFIIPSNITYAVEKVSSKDTEEDKPITIDDIMGGAENFIKSGESSSEINTNMLNSTSNFSYNLLLGIGIITAVGVGIALGIKYMVGSIDEKAELKQVLIGYLVSCIVVFGAFGIWKLVIEILDSM